MSSLWPIPVWCWWATLLCHMILTVDLCLTRNRLRSNGANDHWSATSETLSHKEAFSFLGCFLRYLAKVTKRNWLQLFYCQYHTSHFNCWLKDAGYSLTSFSRAFCAAGLFIDTVHESLWICRFIYGHTHPRPFYGFHSYVQETSASLAQLRSFLV